MRLAREAQKNKDK